MSQETMFILSGVKMGNNFEKKYELNFSSFHYADICVQIHRGLIFGLQ